MNAEEFIALLNGLPGRAGRPAVRRGDSQWDIITVRPDDRVLQILAGPGSGKTENLVSRILFELFVGIGKPTPASQILVTTFTKKAATELEVRLVERCDALLAHARSQGFDVEDPKIHDLRIGTLHSLCDRLLGEFDDEYTERGTRLIDEHETVVRLAMAYRFDIGIGLIDSLLAIDGVTALFRPPWDGGRWPSTNMDKVKFVQALIAQHTETWVPRCGKNRINNGLEEITREPALTDSLIRLHDKWWAYLDRKNVLDFTAIQEKFLQRQDKLLDNFTHVFVDEFQDTNPIQFAIHTSWLQNESTRLTVVGDDDQSIYRFRGSDIDCFRGLADYCLSEGITYRSGKLEENWRSTRAIVGCSEAFRNLSSLRQVTMDKTVRPAPVAAAGYPVRLLSGPWADLCDVVAAELAAGGVSTEVSGPPEAPVDAAVLLFSTSEKSSRTATKPADEIRRALEAQQLRVYNPRNKTAGVLGSPVHDIFALISYLIDPVRVKRIPGRARAVEVHATCRESDRWPYADSLHKFRIVDGHAQCQKRFRKNNGSGLNAPHPRTAELLDYVDQIRDRLVAATASDKPPALTLAGFVARLLSFPQFRHCGYTPELFRQALLTSLIESHVAPSRETMRSLDSPLRPSRNPETGQIDWPDACWNFLNHFGALLNSTTLDDLEVEAFADNAIAMLTFHQAKGLEFDHVYVGCTGRSISPDNALCTEFFSGRAIPAVVVDGHYQTRDPGVLAMAAADRDREVYVAITRAKQTLTILHDPGDTTGQTHLNPALETLFAQATRTLHPRNPAVQVFSLNTTGTVGGQETQV
ncbi:ATP-dependent helicase [Actinoallomurus oryzae]|uniref:ATP-dependent helicase n=1 Tax=Actinoallomurus oryzae TaxID=502180 RepID=UPI0031F0F3F5